MRTPQVVVLEPDGWIARTLGDLAAEDGWLIRRARSVATARSLVSDRQPCVLLVQVELSDELLLPFQFMAEIHRKYPDVPIVVVSETKLNDADRVAWTATLFELGARFALFPPLTRPVLEDVVSGLMTATIRRTVGEDAAPAGRTAATKTSPGPDEVIDLADEDVYE
jgi:DNA-binding response OmpR family regulator